MHKNCFPDLNISILNSKSRLKNYFGYRSFLKKVSKTDVISDTWIILGAGPSLELFDGDPEFRALLEKYPVVSIKQAGLKYPDLTNIQVFNEVRYNPEYSSVGNYRMSVSDHQKNSKTNLHFPITSYKIDQALFRNNNYQENELVNRFRRPWGVGIFFELAIFLPVLFRAKKIILCGIDMNSQGKFHFYDDKDAEDSKSYKVDDFEFYFTKGTVPYLEYWLKKKSIEIFNLSPLSEMPFKKYLSVKDLNKDLSL
jgi:hypothetical protein